MHKVFGDRLPHTYYDREGAYLIPRIGTRVAVVRTPKGYFLIGGGIEDGEDDHQCLLRECMEETGRSVSIGDCICSAETFTTHPKVGYFHPIQRYYTGTLGEMVATPAESDHTLEWVECDWAIDNMFSDMQGWAIQQSIHKE